MNKKVLFDIINGLEFGKEVDINFLDNSRSGKYKFLTRKIWRGKYGTLKATLVNLASLDTIEVSSVNNKEIVSVLVDGQALGTPDKHEITKEKSVDKANAEILKAQFKNLEGTDSIGKKANITFSDPLLNGTYTIQPQEYKTKALTKMVGAKLNRGLFGQYSISVKNDQGYSFTIWSYRHSALIKTFEVMA